jgi:arylsulfatase A-like enzyme
LTSDKPPIPPPGDISRRTLLRSAALGTIALASGLDDVFAQTVSRPPNIVFLMADDLGFADLSCYGRRDFSTPNIDHLATTGTRFTQAYANSAVCSATRTALITGRYQDRLALGLEEPLTNRDVGLPAQQPTLPAMLKRAGYGTTLVGKWHLGALPRYGPLQSGYDHFYGFRKGAIDYYSHAAGDHIEDLWDDDVQVHQSGYLTDLLGNRAVEVITGYAKSDRPFFASIHFNAPHWPWEAPGDEAESQRLSRKALPDFDGGSQKTYQRMVQAMDVQVGRILQTLDARGLTENTIVIFTSDNGGERFSDTWPFTGRKTELLEGGLRIPSVISWPARIPRAATTDQVSMTMDWMPTLLAAAGVPQDQAFASDGIDLLPVLTKRTPPVPRKLFWRYKANAQRAARDGDYKYLKILDNTFLFNVADDPMERANLKERQQDIYDRLVAQWYEWNAAMLPEIDESVSGSFTGEELADHIGAPEATGKADNPAPPKSGSTTPR